MSLCTVARLAGELLGRHVGRRAGAARPRSRRASHGQAEVGDARAAVAVDHDVGRLQVAVQDALVVRRGQAARRAGARSRSPCRSGRRPMRRSSDGEVLAVHVLHARGSGARRPRRCRRRGRRAGARRWRALRTSAWKRSISAGVLAGRPRAGTSARPAARASDRRRDRPRPCRRGRGGRRCGSARRGRARREAAAVERRRGGNPADGAVRRAPPLHRFRHRRRREARRQLGQGPRGRAAGRTEAARFRHLRRA